MKKKIFLIVTLLFSFMVTVNAAKINATSVDLYALNEAYKDKLSIPNNYKKSFQIVVSENNSAPEYYVGTYDSSDIEVSDSGLITPKARTWYCKSNMCSTGPIEGYTSKKSEYEFGVYTVKVKVDNQTFEIKVNVKNYATTYAQDYMKSYLNNNITSNMTERQKMEKIVSFVVSYPYSASSSSYLGFILGDGADCIGSANTIIWMANELGIKAHMRWAANDPGAGNNHHNVAAILDGELYIVEAGYSSSSNPRPYNINLTKNGWSANYQYDGYDKTVNIPSTYTKIGDLALYRGLHNDSNIQILNVPQTLTTLGKGTFSRVSTLKAINVDTNNANFKSVDGILYSKDGKILYTYPGGKVTKNYTVLNTVEEISAYAFSGNSNLNSITIPSSVKKIGYAAFYDDKNLTQINIEEGVQTIDAWAFSSTKIKSLIIPKSVTSIGSYAFYNVNNIEYVKFLNKDTKIDDNAKLTSVKTIYGYKGSTAESYAKKNNITFKDITNEYSIANATITDIKDKVYNGKTQKQIAVVKINNTVLKEGVDYTLTYKDNKDVGIAVMTFNGIGSYSGTVTKKFIINSKKISKTTIKVDLNSKEFTDKKIKPKVVITDGKTTLKKDVDYKITYKNNKNVGTAQIIIEGINNYGGKVTKKFYIIPKSTTIKNVTGLNKSLSLTWKKQKVQTTGYKIEYSVNKNFSNSKKILVKKNTIKYLTLNDLLTKKKYYIRIRTYKVVNGKKYYSNWSKTKTIKTK